MSEPKQSEIWLAAMSQILAGMTKFERDNPGSLHPDAYSVAMKSLRVKPEPENTAI